MFMIPMPLQQEHEALHDQLPREAVAREARRSVGVSVTAMQASQDWMRSMLSEHADDPERITLED